MSTARLAWSRRPEASRLLRDTADPKRGWAHDQYLRRAATTGCPRQLDPTEHRTLHLTLMGATPP